MNLFEQLEWTPHFGGDRAVMAFPNGYSASVLRGGPFYTDGGTYEVAVMNAQGVDYTTPIADDVLGHLSKDKAEKALCDIRDLPPA